MHFGREISSIRRVVIARVAASVMATACAVGFGAASASAAPPAGAPAVESAPSSIVGASPTLPNDVIAASSAPGSGWTAEKPTYGVGGTNDIAVTGADGTTIRVNEAYPTLADGKPAPGPFPVLLTMTPYGKGSVTTEAPGAGAGSSGSVTGGQDSYMIERGYIEVVMDVRGTGDSGGSFGLFDPIQTQDAIKVLDWAAGLANSNGKVGTFGPSYLGIDQLLLAGSVSKNSPLKAIFPVVPANDVYRDTSFMGGLLDSEFDLAYLGLTTGLNQANPAADGLTDTQLLAQLASVETDHANSVTSYVGTLTAQIMAGEDPAYDQTYWKDRAPETTLANVVANDIPAYLVGGEFDIFQHGETANYAALQNAWAGRPMDDAMVAGQKVTGRYQLIDGPWEHINGSSVQVDPVELEWFDTWLKGENTGMATTPTPLHYYNLGTGNFDETTNYPFSGVPATHLYFGSGNTLSSTAPAASSGTDTLVWTPSGQICGRAVDQWAMGAFSLASQVSSFLGACQNNDSVGDVGPSHLSYTTAPLTSDETLAGPVNADVFMSATTADTELVAELEDVTPDGSAFPITEGALLGSQRALIPGRDWTENGLTIMPYHPYTQAAAAAVTPGQTTEYQIEIFPTLITLAKGDRLRITLSTADTPHLTPIPADLAKMTGGIYTVDRSAGAASGIDVPMISGDTVPSGVVPATSTPAPAACTKMSGGVNSAQVGSVRLGMSRTQINKTFKASSSHGRTAMEYYCFSSTELRVGYVDNKAVLVLTANRKFALKGVSTGSSLAAAKRAFHLGGGYVIGQNTWYVVSFDGGAGLLKVVHNKVAEIGITAKSEVRTRTVARRFLSSF